MTSNNILTLAQGPRNTTILLTKAEEPKVEAKKLVIFVVLLMSNPRPLRLELVRKLGGTNRRAMSSRSMTMGCYSWAFGPLAHHNKLEKEGHQSFISGGTM